ncbi:MAG: pyruvate kinase [Clostridium baratii]
MRIIATMGPSIRKKKVIGELIKNNVDTFRFNFSHGSIDEFNNMKNNIKSLNEDIDIMVDLPGNKIRISDKLLYIYKIYNGEEIIFCGEDVYVNKGYVIRKGETKIIPLNIKDNTLNEDDIESISMKDGTMQFEVIKKEDRGIRVRVKKGGIIRAGKGFNIKGYIRRDKKDISKKDKIGLDWAIKNNADIICESFVEDISDINIVKRYIEENSESKYKPTIFAKVETIKGVENINKIADEVSGIVIGRGDLVPESSIIEAPIYQGELIKNLKNYDGEIIAGTHILNSMKRGWTAEFSEVDSIYNLICNGVKGFLLSGETSIGKAPIKTVKFLNDVVNIYKSNIWGG